MQKSAWFLALVALLATSCSSTDTTDTKTEDKPESRRVQVDGRSAQYAGAALSYFPDEVTLHAGDSVDFKQVFSGEPHSVTFGKLVDEAIPAAKKLGEQRPEGELKAKLEALPSMLPEGPGDANQIAVNPCFIESGALPADETKPCPKVDQPEFQGTETYYSSGYLAPDAGDFKVKLADNIKGGDYSYYCNLHGPQMSGTIKVVDKDTAIPSAAEVAAEGKEQLAAAFAPTDKAYQAASAGQAPFPLLAGFGSEESESTGINAFIPGTAKAKVGQKVTWTFFGFHTISFNPPPEAVLAVVKAPDGTFHANEKMSTPVGGPGMPEPPAAGESSASPPASSSAGASAKPSATASANPSASSPSSASPTAPGSGEASPSVGAGGALPEPTEVDAGKYTGDGFRSSGLFFSFPPDLVSYSMTFTKAGTYSYVCLIHPEMIGTVEVA